MFTSAVYSLVETFCSLGTLLELLQQLLVYSASPQFKAENNRKSTTVQNYTSLEKLHLTENTQPVI